MKHLQKWHCKNYNDIEIAYLPVVDELYVYLDNKFPNIKQYTIVSEPN